MQIVEKNSVYLINSNSDISRIEGLGVYGEIQQRSSQSKADLRQQRSAGQGAVANGAVVGGEGVVVLGPTRRLRLTFPVAVR